MERQAHAETRGGQRPPVRRRVSRRLMIALLAILIAVAGGTAIAVYRGSTATALPSAHPAPSAGGTATPAAAGAKPSQNLCAPGCHGTQSGSRPLWACTSPPRRCACGCCRGQPLQVVAAAQHIAPAGLHLIEIHALQVGDTHRDGRSLGCDTQQEGDAYLQIYRRMTPAQLNQEFTTVFVES